MGVAAVAPAGEPHWTKARRDGGGEAKRLRNEEDFRSPIRTVARQFSRTYLNLSGFVVWLMKTKTAPALSTC